MTEFDPQLPVPDEEPGLTQPEGYLLSGESLRDVTIEEIRAKLGELGLEPEIEITPVADLSVLQAAAEQGEGEPEPIPATQEMFASFAVEHGYTATRGHWSWHSVARTGTERYVREHPDDPYPPIRWVNEAVYKVIELRSVYERLAASTRHPGDAWHGHTPDSRRFLAHLVNELVQPEEPLEIRSRGRRKE